MSEKKEMSEITESLTAIFNRVEEERKFPIQWGGTAKKSLHKATESKEEILKSRREIFIINIVSKG